MRYIPFVAMALLLIIACGGCGAQYITEEQAKDAVRAFEGNPNLQFTEVEFGEHNDGPEWNHEGWFTLHSGIYPESAGYRVDAATGEVTMASYHDRELPEPVNDPPGPLTQQDCLQIAEDYARGKYSGFDAMNFHLAEGKWDYTSWEFSWEQTLDYEALSFNSVVVKVNPIDGLIGRYSSDRVAMTQVRPPQVTSEQAIEIARQALGIVTIDHVDPPTLRCHPDGGSHWRVEITGLDVEGYYPDDVLLVDAETGEVVGDSGPSGGIPSPPTASLSAIRGDLVLIRELTASIPGARVHWLGKEARLFVGRNRYTLVPGKDTIEWTGGTIKLSQKMKVVNGRLFVPSGFLDVLKSAPAPKRAPPIPAKPK